MFVFLPVYKTEAHIRSKYTAAVSGGTKKQSLEQGGIALLAQTSWLLQDSYILSTFELHLEKHHQYNKLASYFNSQRHTQEIMS